MLNTRVDCVYKILNVRPLRTGINLSHVSAASEKCFPKGNVGGEVVNGSLGSLLFFKTVDRTMPTLDE